MAQVTALSRNLQLQFEVGTAANGAPKLQNRNFANVSPSASDDDVLAIGEALAGLFADSLYRISRIDATGLSETSTTTTP